MTTRADGIVLVDQMPSRLQYGRRVPHEVRSQQYLVLPIEETSDPRTVTVEAGT